MSDEIVRPELQKLIKFEIGEEYMDLGGILGPRHFRKTGELESTRIDVEPNEVWTHKPEDLQLIFQKVSATK